MTTRSQQPMTKLKKEKVTPPQEKKALMEESQETDKKGENKVLTPPYVCC